MSGQQLLVRWSPSRQQQQQQCRCLAWRRQQEQQQQQEAVGLVTASSSSWSTSLGQQLVSQGQALWGAVKQKHILLPTLFVFLWQSTPTADTAMFYFYTNELHFTPEFLGRVRLAGSIASLAGERQLPTNTHTRNTLAPPGGGGTHTTMAAPGHTCALHTVHGSLSPMHMAALLCVMADNTLYCRIHSNSGGHIVTPHPP
jgi:hypothetical protein